MKTARPPRAVRRHLAQGPVDLAEAAQELPRSPFALRLLITACAFLLLPILTFLFMALPLMTGGSLEVKVDGEPVQVTAANWTIVAPFLLAGFLILLFCLVAIPLSARFALRRRLWVLADEQRLHLYGRLRRRTVPWSELLSDVRVEGGSVRVLRQRPTRTRLDEALQRADVEAILLDVKDPERAARVLRKRIAR